VSDLLLSPPVAAAIFLALACGLYQLGGVLAPKAKPSKDKQLPYTGGELPLPLPYQQSYHAFFRLALFFSILHVAALVLSTLPAGRGVVRTAMLYLGGIAVSVFALTDAEE